MTKKVLVDLNVTGKVTANKGLELPSTTAPVTLNGQNGILGDVLTSAGSGTPTWTTPVTSGTKTANTFLAGPVFGGGGATFRSIDYRDIYPGTPPTNYGQVIQYAPVGNGMAWTSAAPLLVTGGSVSGALNLSSTTAPLQVQGSAGSTGEVLISQGAGVTPIWGPAAGGVSSVSGTSPIVSSGGATPAISIDQTSVYQGNIWTNPNNYTIDFSGSSLFKSVLGSDTRAFTMQGNSTYEVELYMQVGQTFISNTSSTVAFQWRTTTTSGSPTINVAFFNSYSQSTTQTLTGSVTVQRNAGATGNIIVPSVNSTTPNRFGIVQSRGQVRISGAGTVTISPSLQTNAVTDNGITVYSNYFMKITRIGSNNMTNLGTWTS